MNLCAVAFDLDSTLSYYPLSTRDVLERALASVGASDRFADLDEAAKRYDGAWAETERRCGSIHETRRSLFAMLLGERESDLSRRLAVAYDEIRTADGVRLYEGAKHLLDALAPRVRLGLLTNGSSEMQWPKLRNLGIDSSFYAIVIAGEHGVYKPDRRVFDLLAERLACPIERTLFVGDDYDTDVRGAHAAGMRTAWLRHPGTERPETPVHDIELGRIDELEGRVS